MLFAAQKSNCSARLAEMTWDWCDGRTGGVLTWLQRLGCRILSRPERGGTWVLEGIAGGNAALSRGHDPATIAQALGFLCGGMLWPQAFPELLPLVTKEWRRRSRVEARG